MKKIYIIILSLFLSSALMAAGSDSSSGSSSSMGDSLYEDAVKLVKRAGKLEKKDKSDKAKKLYAQAFNKLEKAYKADKRKVSPFKNNCCRPNIYICSKMGQ